MDETILRLKRLHDILLDRISRCGYDILFIRQMNKHPLDVVVKRSNKEACLRIFIWNITHGGKTRAKGEYRIQIKVPQGEQVLLSDMLLGCYKGEVFVGYDATKHTNPKWSSSMQIGKDTLESAYAENFSTYINKRHETVFAFNADYLGVYIENYRDIHGTTTDGNVDHTPLSQKDEIKVHSGDEHRERVQRIIHEHARSADFRKKVLGAYGNKCSFCGLQIGITEAAHILPVSIPSSTDETSNGLCLCPNHHKTYDSGMLYVSEGYQIVATEKHIDRLRQLELTENLEDFIKNTRDMISLPHDKKDYPNISYIEKANKLRLSKYEVT